MKNSLKVQQNICVCFVPSPFFIHTAHKMILHLYEFLQKVIYIYYIIYFIKAMCENVSYSLIMYTIYTQVYYTKVSGRPRCHRYRTFYRRAWCIVCRPLNARFFYPFQPSNAKEIMLCIIFFGPFFCRVSFRPLCDLLRTRPTDNNIIIARSLFLRHFSHTKIDSHTFSVPPPLL